MNLKVAVLIDGSFFLKRLGFYKKKYFNNSPELTAKNTVSIISKITLKHLLNIPRNSRVYNHLYRVFFYDAEPYTKKGHYPLPRLAGKNAEAIDFSKQPTAIFRLELLQELKRQRKLALRLGTLKTNKNWNLKANVLKQLIKQEREFTSLTNDDFVLDIRQKGVDIKLGIDIATLAYEKLVDKIILIAGDTDFVPAAKLARTKGIEFVLDPLRSHIDESLHEHIDGLVNFDLVSLLQEELNTVPEIQPSWWQASKAKKL